MSTPARRTELIARVGDSYRKHPLSALMMMPLIGLLARTTAIQGRLWIDNDNHGLAMAVSVGLCIAFVAIMAYGVMQLFSENVDRMAIASAAGFVVSMASWGMAPHVLKTMAIASIGSAALSIVLFGGMSIGFACTPACTPHAHRVRCGQEETEEITLLPRRRF